MAYPRPRPGFSAVSMRGFRHLASAAPPPAALCFPRCKMQPRIRESEITTRAFFSLSALFLFAAEETAKKSARIGSFRVTPASPKAAAADAPPAPAGAVASAAATAAAAADGVLSMIKRTAGRLTGAVVSSPPLPPPLSAEEAAKAREEAERVRRAPTYPPAHATHCYPTPPMPLACLLRFQRHSSFPSSGRAAMGYTITSQSLNIIPVGSPYHHPIRRSASG